MYIRASAFGAGLYLAPLARADQCRLVLFGRRSLRQPIFVTYPSSNIRDLVFTESVTCGRWLSAPHQRSLSIIANFDTFKDPVLGRGGLNVATTAAGVTSAARRDLPNASALGEMPLLPHQGK